VDLLSPGERLELRARAIAGWENAKRLQSAAEGLVSDARHLRRDAAGIRAQGATHPAVLRVDRIIERRPADDQTVQTSGLGLVVASRISRMSALHDALHERLPQVWSARDPAGALGLTIVNQPDITVVDDDLPVMTGLDMAVLIRSYAPASRVVLFTDDTGAARQAEMEGVATGRASFSVDDILAAIDAAA
jgi:CheY-like chemotaxis protein